MLEAENLTVIIEWESNSGCLNYTVFLTSLNSSSNNIITTKNSRHTFNIFYNTNYTVTVSGSNGSEISKTFNFSKSYIKYYYSQHHTNSHHLYHHMQLNVNHRFSNCKGILVSTDMFLLLWRILRSLSLARLAMACLAGKS